MNKYKINPFTPDAPVEPALFAGRKSEIGQIRTALYNTYANKAQHILVRGDKWIGKTSIARYAESMATMANIIFEDEKANFFTSFCRLGSCRSLSEVCISIISNLKNVQSPVRIKIFGLLSKIKGLSVGPFGVQFAQDARKDFIVPTFPTLFERLLDEAKGSYQGLLVILDETEYISALPGIGSFIKTLLEELHGDGYRNIMFLLTATPEGIERFTSDHASFPRLFRYIDLDLMGKAETRELMKKALQAGEPIVSIDESAIEFIYYHSGGFPGVAQELGYAIWEANTDDVIDDKDCLEGAVGIPGRVKGAIDTLYDKHFKKVLTPQLLSYEYGAILEVVATSRDAMVTFDTLEEKLSSIPPKRLAGYLGNLVKKGIIKRRQVGRQRGYDIPSQMLRIWLRLKQIHTSS